MQSFNKSPIYSLFLLFTLVLTLVISYLIIHYFVGMSVDQAKQTIIMQFAFAFIFLIYILVEMKTTIEIDEKTLVEKKIYGTKRFELDKIKKIEYRKTPMKYNSMVFVYHSNGRGIRLNYWYNDFPGLMGVLCKNTRLVNEHVKLSHDLVRDFDL